MRRAARLAVALAATGLAACAHPPAPHPSPGPVPARFSEPQAAGDEADLGAWWRRFGDPGLDALVDRALQANLDLRQAGERIAQARQQEVIAGASRLPRVQAEAAATRNRISENAIPIPPGAGGGQAAPFGLPGAEFGSYRLGADAAWELDLFGGQASAAGAARARRQSAEWSRRDLQVAVAAETAARYLELRTLQRRRALAEAELQRQQDLLAIVRSRAEAGLVGGLDLRQQAAEVEAARARIPPLQAQARAQVHAIAVLLAEPPEEIATRLDSGLVPAAPDAPEPPAGLPSELLRRRPDIRRAEREVAAAAADAGVAAAALYPRITLSAQPALVSTALSSLLDWGSRNYAMGAGLLWPVFEGGRLRADLARADARERELLLAYRKTVLTALRDVEDALARLAADDARAAAARAQAGQARAAEALARDRYQSGLTDYAQALAAGQGRIAAEDQLEQARGARAQDLVALYRALGGGWRDTDVREGGS